jgi:hypothetical protein
MASASGAIKNQFRRGTGGFETRKDGCDGLPGGLTRGYTHQLCGVMPQKDPQEFDAGVSTRAEDGDFRLLHAPTERYRAVRGKRGMHYAESFAAIPATCRPWKRAMASSFR